MRELGSIEEELRGIAPDRRLELRYEELVRAPVQVLQRAARFAGLVDDPGWVAELDRLRYPNKNEAWTQRLARTCARGWRRSSSRSCGGLATSADVPQTIPSP